MFSCSATCESLLSSVTNNLPHKSHFGFPSKVLLLSMWGESFYPVLFHPGPWFTCFVSITQACAINPYIYHCELYSDGAVNRCAHRTQNHRYQGHLYFKSPCCATCKSLLSSVVNLRQQSSQFNGPFPGKHLGLLLLGASFILYLASSAADKILL